MHHSLNGRYGLYSNEKLVLKAQKLEIRLAKLREERMILENRVLLLKNGSIERDMLDEQSRYHLNLLHEDEVVIMR